MIKFIYLVNAKFNSCPTHYRSQIRRACKCRGVTSLKARKADSTVYFGGHELGK